MVPPLRIDIPQSITRTRGPFPRADKSVLLPHGFPPHSLLRASLAMAALPATGGCAWMQTPGQAVTLGDLPGLLLLGAVLNGLVLLAMITIWDRATRQGRLRRPLERELRLLRHLATPEGLARKTALLHELNHLGGVPRELDDTVLSGADLRGMCLAGCRLRSVRLDHADLQGADLRDCDLFGADLAHANLAMADLTGSDLRSADLESAQLIKTNLTGVRLRRANLVNADLQGADLSTARLEHARFATDSRDPLPRTMHPSVDDWVRARLDVEGRFHPLAEGNPPEAQPLSDAS